LSRPDRSRPTSERTAEERERAREERERRRERRSASDGGPSLPTPAPGIAAAGQEPPGGERNPKGAQASDEPLAQEPARAGGQGPREQAPVSQALGQRAPERAAAEESPASPGEPPWRAPQAVGPRSTRARVAALLALAAAAALVWFLVSLFQPFAGPGSGKVIVDIPKGTSSSQIGSILARDGVVPSGFFFELRAFLEGRRGDLHSGRYLLKRDMSYAAAIAALSAPPPALIAVKVVIPEGFTRLQIARLAQQETLSGSYLAASSASSLLDPASYGARHGVGSLEGFLFPATYELSAGDPAQRLVEEQLSAFRLRFGTTERRRARALGVTPYQLLTVASMVEREAQVPRDGPLIAAVVYNRLRRGMALGIDATIYYALALHEGIRAYGRELTASELQLDSPYNTRLHTGLPPTPIANPGWASIEAAAHPAHVSYLYYVAAPDGCGAHVFSSSYARFQADAAAYQAALRRNGGHLPTCKRK
jgi:UPF0755 protein